MITYREATPDDATAMGVARETGQWSGGAGAATMARYLAGEHHPQHAQPQRVAFVAEAAGIVVGFVAGHLTHRFACDGELQWIFVLPEYRRHGVADELFHLIAEWFVEQHAARVCVNVEPENAAARAFYAQRGARPLSEYWMEWTEIRAAQRTTGPRQLPSVRRQLTLFVPDGTAPWLEPLRQQLDPVQRDLIAAHVTLCREDEIVDLELPALWQRLATESPVTLIFGAPRRFDGHGLLLPCVDGATAFQQLRVRALDSDAIRTPEAHLTLAHPRNPRAPGNIEAKLGALPVPLSVTFRAVALIEQINGQPWEVRETVTLTGRDAGAGE